MLRTLLVLCSAALAAAASEARLLSEADPEFTLAIAECICSSYNIGDEKDVTLEMTGEVYSGSVRFGWTTSDETVCPCLTVDYDCEFTQSDGSFDKTCDRDISGAKYLHGMGMCESVETCNFDVAIDAFTPLPLGMIIGIAAAVVVVCCGCGCFCWRRRKSKKTAAVAAPAP